jgi:Zn-dependent protease with chaperone function
VLDAPTDGSGVAGGDGNPTRSPVTLTHISPRAWEHPADRGALAALRRLKGFDVVVRQMSGLFNERSLRLLFLGSAVRTSDRQFGRVHHAFAGAAGVLDVRDLPELYVAGSADRYAITLGLDQPFVVVSSGLVDLLDDAELRFALGHELGHVLSGHAIYRTVLLGLLRLGAGLSWVPIGGLGVRALIAALQEWARKSELSADRAGLLATQDPAAALRVQMKLAGGGSLADVDAVEFLGQAQEYDAAGDLRDSLLKLLLVEGASHPFLAVRAGELRRWVDTGAYAAVLAGDYPRRGGGDGSVSAEAQAAARSYAEAFARSQDPLKRLVRDAAGVFGDGVGGLRSRFGGRPPSTEGSSGEDRRW